MRDAPRRRRRGALELVALVVPIEKLIVVLKLLVRCAC
ncbi:hypothetical protein CU044_1764 [Streptomyces sp. L-9-10]|nr:hypothetical protein CU044_1764 [Streptomyces sp. L-9-10]